jgi:hypothetical protein
MWRQLLTVILLLVMFGATGDVKPISATAEETHFYLPLVEKSPPQIELIVTDIYNYAFTSYNHIYGYVHSLIPDPYYSVTLEAEGTFYPFCDDDEPCDPVTVKIPISPALPATLPNQINPFSDSNLCYKACTVYHSVRVVSASRTEPNGDIYLPLTVVKWHYTAENEYSGILSGTIRNDNHHTLQNLRLVVAELEKCSWREAEIAGETLNPNRQTTFQLSYYESCLGDNFVIVGQGAALP